MSGIPRCPQCNSDMVMRNGERGQFYGCSQFNFGRGCRGWLPITGRSSGATDASGKWSSGGSKAIKSKYDGRCNGPGGCGSDYKAGDNIVYDFEARQTVGCPACAPAGVHKAHGGGPVFITDPKAKEHWDSIIAADTVQPTWQPLPMTVEQCHSVPACTIPLDDFQLQAVRWRSRHGEAIDIASAGSGKSTVLLWRIVELIRDGVIPETIATFMYGRSAMEDFRRRLVDILGGQLAHRVPVHTFHGWAYGLINEWMPGRFGRGKVVGVEDGPNPMVLGKKAKELANVGGLDTKDAVGLSTLIREALIDCEGTLPQLGVATQIQSYLDTLHIEISLTAAAEAAAFTRAYQQVKARAGVIDFADMLWLVNKAIDYGGQRARQLQERYTNVQVDEFQDTNPARMRIAAHLGGGIFDPFDDANNKLAPKMLGVGDMKQSVFSFTGARPDIIMRRLKLGATMLEMPVNRRSTAPIVAAGNAVSKGREWNLGREAVPAKVDPAAEPVRVWMTETPSEEAEQIVSEVLARIPGAAQAELVWNPQEGRDELDLDEETIRKGLVNAKGRARFCCLVRTNAQATVLECAFMARNIPVRIVGEKGGVWTTTPGREVLAYLRAAGGKPDKDIARVSNKPNRAVKRDVVTDALSAAEFAGNFTGALRATQDRGAVRLALDLEHLATLEWNLRCREVLGHLLRDLQERAAVNSALGVADEDAEATYRGLVDAAITLGSVEAIDEQIAAMTKVGERSPAVEVCTIHKAKGAEWEVVFVCGVAVGTLPHQKAQDTEEELRLFYVALTRAILAVIVSIGGKEPSPFVRLVLPLTKEGQGMHLDGCGKHRRKSCPHPPEECPENNAGAGTCYETVLWICARCNQAEGELEAVCPEGCVDGCPVKESRDEA